MTFKKYLLGTIFFASAVVCSNNAISQNFYSRPNIATGLGATSTTFSANTFINHGLVGAGRVDASLKDAFGDTLGSFSGMALDLSTWRKSGTSYSALLYTLPDRGYNDTSYSNYNGRISAFNLNFTPYIGSASLPASTTSQNQLTLNYNASKSFLLKDFNGNPTTGEDPGASTTLQNGYVLPMVAAGLEGAGRIAIDAEALVMRRDGTFYVGDEYTGGIYHFDATGKMIGFIAPPNSILPRTNGTINYNSLADASTGRRNNQGMESVSLTADGKYLFGVMQSATVQDSLASNQATRLNTRVLMWDVSNNATPTNPIAHYVLQLPTIDRDGTGGSADRTAAQSEILALNQSQFLMLTRDGNGLDNGDSRPIVFKSIYLVDVTGATNLAGTEYETGATSVAPNGALLPSITAVKSAQFVNMLNIDQLTKFGLNLDSDPSNLTRTNNRLTLSEKWEAMALAPTLEEGAPQDFFLFVGNDNDFQTRTGTMLGDAQYNSYDDGAENDSLILVYRVTLPTYVDPTYRLYLEDTAPKLVKGLAISANDAAKTLNDNIFNHRMNQIASGNSQAQMIWGYFLNGKADKDANYYSDFDNYSVGIDYAVGKHITIGAAIGRNQAQNGKNSYSFDTKTDLLSSYINYVNNGFYGYLSLNTGRANFNNISRAAGYGQIAQSYTNGVVAHTALELGKSFAINNKFAIGPTIGFGFSDSSIDGFNEAGASGGNLVFAPIKTKNNFAKIGILTKANFAKIATNLSVNYVANAQEATISNAKLTSAQSNLANLDLGRMRIGEDQIEAKLGLSGEIGKIGWELTYYSQFGQDTKDINQYLGLGLGYKF
jgi:uncharacterized protein YhjY with autotransporter beta-barrel domain